MNAYLLAAALLVAQPNNASAVFIDRELATRWQQEKLTPASKTNDLEFLRRASIDLIGRIPTRDEQRSYLQAPPEARRRLLVDRLLRHDDYPYHWANVWSHLLMPEGIDGEVGQAFHGWLERHFAKNGSHKELAENLLLAKGTPRDHPAVHFFQAYRGQAFPQKDWKTYGQYDMFPLTGQVFRALHGKCLQCLQCHDHPFDDELRQADFFQMNLFFRQVRHTKVGAGKKAVESIDDDPQLNESGLANYERRNGIRLRTQPRFYQGDPWKKTSKQTRREFFVERFVKHTDFARAHVNMLWDHFFGRGLTHWPDFDDMIGANAVMHPKMLDHLANEFVKSGHDSKALMRAICLSDAYGLQSVANKTNDAPEKDVFFSRVLARRMSRSQFAESLIVALTGEAYLKRRSALRAEFRKEMTHLEFPEVTHCEAAPYYPERDATFPLTLWMLNNRIVEREFSAPTGIVATTMAKGDGASLKGFGRAANELYQLALCRPTRLNEMKRLTDPTMYRFRASAKEQTPPPEFWMRYAEDLYWALLNSNEFGLNH